MDGPTPNAQERVALDEVLQAMRRVRHGYVQVIIQDSKVVQIDTMEKRRLGRPPAP